VIRLACELPAESRVPLARWSSSELAAEAVARGICEQISGVTVWRWLSEDAIKPWQHRSWIFPRDPDFAGKAGRILDLYGERWEGERLHPGDYVVCCDEKPSIQARRRKHSTLPAANGVKRGQRVEHEYERRGALCYLAAWDARRAKLFDRCAPKDGIVPFDQLVDQFMSTEPYSKAQRVFVIADNGSAHRGKRSIDRLQGAYKNLILVHTPVGERPRESLSELARLGARLIIQRAVEDEFDAWLGRARYERRPDDQHGVRNDEGGLRNGFRSRKLQTAEGELEIEIPQVREAAETFASKLFPRGTKLVRTEPLKALVIGAFVRGLSMRDVESLCEQAGLGKLSKSTASRICEELKERYRAFCRRDLYGIRLVALFLDATFIAVRPDGPKEGVQVAWGFTEDGERVLLSVMLGMRESYEDWQTLGRDLIARGLGAPMLIVAAGAPGLIKAIEQCWPASDRQRCSVHRARNLYAKLPERERERVKQAYWRALDDAISEQDAKQRLQALVRAARYGRLHRRGQMPRRRSRRAGRSPALPAPAPPQVAVNESPRKVAR
jgi:transposase-like protein